MILYGDSSKSIFLLIINSAHTFYSVQLFGIFVPNHINDQEGFIYLLIFEQRV